MSLHVFKQPHGGFPSCFLGKALDASKEQRASFAEKQIGVESFLSSLNLTQLQVIKE